MSDLFEFKPPPSAYAVMGNPVAHSKSPQIHSQFAHQTGVALSYDRIQVDVGGFDQAVSHFAANGGAGLNITVPFKVEAWQLCSQGNNHLTDRAQVAQAVNTLKFESDGTTLGDNTDGAGLVTDLENNNGVAIKDKSILVIGAGGAVRGVLGSILACLPADVTVANRTADKAQELETRFDGVLKGTGLDRIPGRQFDLIINGTAASLDGNLPDLPLSCVGPQTVVYDMMYADQPTVFMKWGMAAGAASAHDGLGMLVEQAAESFRLWRNTSPDTRPVIDALRKL